MFFEKRMAAHAIELLKPTIGEMLDVHNKEGLHIVIIAGKRPDDTQNEEVSYPVVYDDCLRHPVQQCRHLAMGKARVSWRTSAPSDIISSRYPELIQKGDSLYTGGIAESVDNFCVAVGVSGLKDYHDEALAKSILAFIKAEMIAKARLIMEDDGLAK